MVLSCIDISTFKFDYIKYTKLNFKMYTKRGYKGQDKHISTLTISFSFHYRFLYQGYALHEIYPK